MKKLISLALAALMTLTLAACSGKPAETPFSKDLQAFFDSLEYYRQEDGPFVSPLDEDTLEYYFPGLAALERVQTVAYGTLISLGMDELVLVELANAEDVATLQALFQARIDAQVDGGAFYPGVVQVWQEAEIVTRGNYVCLFVSPEKDDIVAAFLAQE